MTPPLHVKITSALCSTLFLSLGVRNIVAPGTPLSFLPNDDKGQKLVWGTDNPSSLTVGQKAYSNLLGCAFLILSAVKLTTLFSVKEGTFLRRNLFLALGGSQLLMVLNMNYKFRSAFKAAGASWLGFTVVIGGDALVLLLDAVLRDRPVKSR